MRNIIKVKLSSRFKKSFRKLPSKLQEKAIKKTNIFRSNPFHPSLKTHPLSGKLRKCWAFSVDDKYRIKFVFLEEKALFLDIGTHNEVYK